VQFFAIHSLTEAHASGTIRERFFYCQGGRMKPSNSALRYLPICLLGLSTAHAQISTAIVEQNKAGFEKQATDADMKREAGTQPRDWNYDLPQGVRTRLITFYVDGGTALHGKLFLPKGFDT
jgi:hypothetical protein